MHFLKVESYVLGRLAKFSKEFEGCGVLSRARETGCMAAGCSGCRGCTGCIAGCVGCLLVETGFRPI